MEKQMNLPKLRFPEYEEKWERKKLGEVAEISSGGTPSRTNQNYWNGHIPWVSTTLIDFNIISVTDEYITPEGLKKSSAKIFPAGTLLMAMYGQGKTRGKIALLGIDSSSNQACGAIMPTKSILCNTFLFQNLTKRYDEIRELSNQGGQENLSGGIIKGIGIFFPTLPEQNRIATFLAIVDEKLQALKKKKSLLEEYKKGVTQKLFSQKLRFKDKDGEDFPEWEEKKLSDLGETYGGLSGKSKENFGTGKPYIQYKQIFDDSKIDIHRFGFVDILEKENQNKVQFGDVFFTVSSETPNEIGMSSVLLDEIEELYLNSFCFGFRANLLVELCPYFSQFLFRSEIFRSEIIKLAQGSTRYNMSKIQLLKIQIYLPSLSEQLKIANFLSAIDEKIKHCVCQIEKTEGWKKGMLQQMFV